MAATEPLLSLSAILTGFGEEELLATGSAERYCNWLGDTFTFLFPELLAAWEQIEREHPDPPSRETALRQKILADPRLGPFARNIALLWYTAAWGALSKEWAQEHQQPEVPACVFGRDYPEGLVWKAAGTHPVGANPTGFGSWALPPTPTSTGRSG